MKHPCILDFVFSVSRNVLIEKCLKIRHGTLKIDVESIISWQIRTLSMSDVKILVLSNTHDHPRLLAVIIMSNIPIKKAIIMINRAHASEKITTGQVTQPQMLSKELIWLRRLVIMETSVATTSCVYWWKTPVCRDRAQCLPDKIGFHACFVKLRLDMTSHQR